MSDYAQNLWERATDELRERATQRHRVFIGEPGWYTLTITPERIEFDREKDA